jgi:hypothetical protein
LKRWAAEFEERMDCSRKTNGPIKVEDFRPDSKVVLFSFKKNLFVSTTNLVYKSQDVTVIDWVIDSGASNHITSSAVNLTSVRPPLPIDPLSVVVGNGSSVPVTSVGNTTFSVRFTLITSLLIPTLFKIFYLFIVSLSTIDVL